MTKKKSKKNKEKFSLKENINLILFLFSLIFSIFLLSATIILGNANSLNTNTTYENNFTHLNVSNSSIVAYYPFDDNVSATTAYDYTNNSNDGTILGGAVYNTSQAIYGGAMTFDGVDDYINIDTAVGDLATTTGTWSAWVKPRDATPTALMIPISFGDTAGTSNIIELRLETTGKLGAQNIVTTARWYFTTDSTTLLTDNQWTHVAIVHDNTAPVMYVNGVLTAITFGISTDKTTWFDNTPNLDNGRIGSRSMDSLGNINNFSGSIDEVMLWNIALNSTEVLAIYNNQTSRFHGTGEMNYTGVNFAGNDTINITLAGCQQNMGTSLRAKVNDGAYVNFDSSCFIKDYNATGNLNSANVTVGFVSDAYNFYTPLVIGNLSLDSRDVIVPNITINLPANNSFSSQTNLSINFTAQSNDLNTCWYGNDTYTANTTLTNCNTNITTVQWSEGQHNLTIYVNDSANSVNSSMVTFTIDTIFPTWSANETNLTSSTLNGKGVYFNITLTDSNPNTYIFSWYNGTAWENTTSSYTNAQEVSISKTINVDVATINWTWYINDSANNLNQTDIWSVTLLADDNVPPNVSFANPTTNATNLSQNFIFANLSFADATSSISMANISLFNSTQNIINSSQGTISTLEINFTGLADGIYYLNASVNDTLGNRNQTETRKIVLDTIAPNLLFINPTTNSTNRSYNNIEANISFSDVTSSISRAVISLYNSSSDLINSSNSQTSPLFINFTGLSDGVYRINATVNDTLNQKNYTETRTIQIDSTFPTLNITYPFNNSELTGINHTLNFTFTEANLDTCLYFIVDENNVINVANTTIPNCKNTTIQVSDTVHNYTLSLYINDSANNLNNTRVFFRIPQPIGTGGQGGGGTQGGGSGAGGGGSDAVNQTLVCSYTENFLKEHLTKSGYNYTYENIVNLTILYNFNENALINPSTFENYLETFETKCNKTFPAYFQPPIIQNVTYLKPFKIINNETECDYLINRKIDFVIPFRWSYKMDSYVPFLHIKWNLNCDNLGFWRWIFRFEEILKPEYRILGFQLWWILSGLIIYGGYRIYKRIFKKKTKYKVRKESSY